MYMVLYFNTSGLILTAMKYDPIYCYILAGKTSVHMWIDNWPGIIKNANVLFVSSLAFLFPYRR
jgi:hypothetical protein